jgi:thiol reductant ABC exporter CydC subunit
VKKTLARLLALMSASRPRLAASAALGAVTVCAGVGLMGSAGYLISRAAEHPPVLSLTLAIVGVRAFGLLRPVARYLERLASHDLALRDLGRVRSRAYERIEPLAPAQLQGYAGGDLLARLVADVDALQDLQLRGIGPALVALVAGAIAVAVAAVLLPAAALVLAAGLLVAGVAVPILAALLVRSAGRRHAPARGRLSVELVELLEAAPELAVFGREEEALERVRAADRDLVAIVRRDALVGGAADGLGLLVAGTTVAGVAAVSLQAHAAGRLDGVLIATLALLALAAFDAVQPLPAAARSLAATVAAGRRVLQLVETQPAIVDPSAAAPAPVPPFALALEGVRASYGGGQAPVLDGADLVLAPGRRVALVGASGAGKTTIVNLLLRFLDPEAGRVTLAGRDLREYRQEDVRGAIAVAGQDSHVFSAGIAANVRIGRPDATDAEVADALARARLWEWVKGLEQGMETAVGENGRRLSGGQRQRLVLARALIADAPILVLDEPAAHLDAAVAEELMADLLSAAGERSLLLITHRPEGLGLVDEVLRLDCGRVVPLDRRAPGARREPSMPAALRAGG